jgi:uncharacterized linocin/CFP29 family protein
VWLDGKGADKGLVKGIVQAITELEEAGHFGPFTCVLANNLYEDACDPATSLVLPRDRILPFLDGQLFRSGTIQDGYGVVVALGGAPLELVVARDIDVIFLQVSPEPRWVFRVSEKLALRTKDIEAVVVLTRSDKKHQRKPGPPHTKTEHNDYMKEIEAAHAQQQAEAQRHGDPAPDVEFDDY